MIVTYNHITVIITDEECLKPAFIERRWKVGHVFQNLPRPEEHEEQSNLMPVELNLVLVQHH